MKTMKATLFLFFCLSLLVMAEEAGFISLFDGETLDGWTLVRKTGRGYVVENHVLVCPADGGGNLFTEKEYSNFVFRFEFKTEPGGNNGVGIRAPLEQLDTLSRWRISACGSG